MNADDLESREPESSGDAAARAGLLAEGLAHHEAGRREQAQAAYRRILAIAPDDADALHLLGVAEHQAGNYATAIEYIGRAIRQNPLVPLYHNNLGSAYQSLNRLDDAARCVSASLELKPDSADAHYNLGVILSGQGEHGKAEACFRQALTLRPDFAQAHFNMGMLARRAGRFTEAAQCFRHVVRIEPNNATAQFLMAASDGQELERAPDVYVADVFDADAGKFDEHLVKNLRYDTPQRLLDLCMDVLRAARDRKDVLDLGCGTGLAGVSFSPFARRLVGVDLSAGMLERARGRQLYDRLEHAELLTMMQAEQNASYDVIVAADVFAYIGKLDGIFIEAKRLLRTGGLFLFSVEALDALMQTKQNQSGMRSFQLNANGRFAHSAAYIRALASGCSFRVDAMLSASTRLEAGKPVSAWLASLASESDA